MDEYLMADDTKHFRELYDAMEDYKGNKTFVERGIDSMNMYTGGSGVGHWTEEALEELNKENRPPLQLPVILPKVNMLVGMEQQQRTHWKAIPFGVEDQDYPKLITPLLYV